MLLFNFILQYYSINLLYIGLPPTGDDLILFRLPLESKTHVGFGGWYPEAQLTCFVLQIVFPLDPGILLHFDVDNSNNNGVTYSAV